MDYFLRQIGPGNSSPLIVELRSDDVVVGRDIYPDLAKYPHVLPQHALFKREYGKWFVKSMQMSKKIYVNNSPLVTHRFKEIIRGDEISFGDVDNQTCFRCCLCSREKEVIDLSTDEPYAPEILVVYNKKVEGCVEKDKQAIKRPVVGANESEYTGLPTLKSNRTPFSSSQESNNETPVPTNSDFMNKSPSAANTNFVYTSSSTTNSDFVYKSSTTNSGFVFTSPSTSNSEFVYTSPSTTNSDFVSKSLLTTKNEQVNDSRHSVNRERKDTTPLAVKNELDDSSPTVRTDYVSFQGNEPFNTNLPIHHKQNESFNNKPFIIKSESMDTNPPTIKSEPVETTNPFTIAQPVNTVPSTLNEPMLNTFPSVKSEPLDSSLNLSHSLSLSTFHSVSVNQIATSSTKDRNYPSDAEHFVNRDSVNKGVSAVESSIDYSCSPTVKSEPVDDVQPSTENDLMDISLSGIKTEFDYSCPPTVRNDHVPFVNDDPPDKNLPARKDEASNKQHSITKSKPMKINPSTEKSQPMNTSDPYTKAKPINERPLSTENDLMDISLSGIKSEFDYSCPPTVRNDHVPFVNDDLPDMNLPARKDEASNKQHSITKTKSIEINPLIAISQPMSASDPFANGKPVNEYPLSNKLMSNTFPAVKSEPVDSTNENLNLSPNFILGISQSDSVFENQFASSSSKEQKIATEKIQAALSSSSAIQNQGFHENLVSRLENLMSNSKDLPSSSHSRNTNDNATSAKSKNHSINSGYSETEDVITISDDETYLDYGSCNSIKQECIDDDYNMKYNENFDINIAEVYNVNEWHPHPLSSENNSILSSINESIKEHEESAKKMLDVGSNSKISPEYSSSTGNISLHGDFRLPLLSFESDSRLSGINESTMECEESAKIMLDGGCSSKNIPECLSPTDNIISVLHNSGMESWSSNSSVSSHDDILYPSTYNKKSGSFSGVKSPEKSSKRTAHFSEKETQSTVSTKKTSSTNKKQPVKRTLPTDPKSLSCSSRKFPRIEEHKSNSKGIKERSFKKSKSSSEFLGGKVIEKNRQYLSIQKAIATTFVDKSEPSKKLLHSSNKKQQPSKRSNGNYTQGMSKISKGAVVTGNLDFKIPKITKRSSSDANIAPSSSGEINLKTAEQTKPSMLDKKSPSIARKPNKCLSRSELLTKEFTSQSTEKKNPVKNVAAVSKKNAEANKSINSVKMNSSAGREIDKTRHKSGSEQNPSNVTSGVSSSNTSSSTGREIDKTRHKSGSEQNPSNVSSSIGSSNRSSFTDRESNKIEKRTGFELNSSKIINGIKSSPIPVIMTHPNITNPKNAPIPVIVSSKRNRNRKSLNEDRTLSETTPKINKSLSQTSPQLMDKQLIYVDIDVNNFTEDSPLFDKHKTLVISRNDFQSQEQSVPKQFSTGVAIISAKNTVNIESQQSYNDQRFNFSANSASACETTATSGSNFQTKHIPFNVTSTSNNARNDLLRRNPSALSGANCLNERTKISGRKNAIIKTIIEWKESWFQQYEEVLKPHKDITDGVLHLPLYFNSLDHYISSFISLLVIEIWEKLSIEYKPIWKDERRVTNKFYFIVTSNEMKGDVFEYKCEALINCLSFEPKVGNLVSLFIQDNHLLDIHPMLGYIDSCEILNSYNDANPELLYVDPSWIKDAKLYRFSVLVKIRPLSPIFNKIMKGNGICSLLHYWELLEACEKLEYSPLCPSFLKPEPTTFFSSYPDVPAASMFSKAQMSIILGISSKIIKQVSEHKLFLVQGAPYTGKTHVILGLLQNLIFTCHSKQKILVVAPSSVAIDEIGSRLITLKKQLHTLPSLETLRFLRLNLEGKISEEMKEFSLDEMYAEFKIKTKEDKLKNLNIKIQTFLKSNDPLQQEELKYLVKKQKELEDQIEFMQSDEKTRLDYYYHLLQESNVILTTVNCCSNSLLQDFCKRNSHSIFSCCIIDEVTQCTELELLQVVSLGINKLILVGDSYGLPANVLSKTAENLGYARSAFERFLCCFSQYQQESPAFELLVQYRMHSDICYFPSYCFYNSLLTTADSIDSSHEHFLAVSSDKILAPYTVFNILEYGNPTLCAESVIRLCIQSVTLKQANSVGIIVPNRELHDVFTDWIKVLKKRSKSAIDNNYEGIEVNTVENFHGRVKDTVFLCWYDDGDSQSFLSNRKKLCVALTRARRSLVVCIFKSKKRKDLDLVNLINDAQKRHCCYYITKTKKMSLILK